MVNLDTLQEHDLVILDDGQSYVNHPSAVELFTVLSHHRSVSVILLVQNMFFKGRDARSLQLCCSHYVWMHNPRDSASPLYLMSQFSPKRAKSLYDAFCEIMNAGSYCYCLFDLSSEQPFEAARVRTHIFPSDDAMICYGDKNDFQR
jgi:hypothetical protein